MDELRKRIDELDRRILELIAERFDVVREIAEYKKEHHLPVEDREREEVVREKYMEFSDRIPKEFLEEFWDTMMYYSKKVQEEVISGECD